MDQVVARAHLRNARRLDLSTAPNPLDHPLSTAAEGFASAVAVFEQDGWTVVWQGNGYPQQFADRIAAARGVTRAAIAYWNVNALTEFSYWQNGRRIVGFTFDDPDHPSGINPGRLRAAMADTVRKPITAAEGRSAIPQYRRLLALTERVTSVHLAPTFLNRATVVIGYQQHD